MARRALGALLAFVAAIAFVVSIVSSSWWSGTPIVDGHPSATKDVHVGLLAATGCNTGGDGTCSAVELGSTVRLAGYGMAGLAALVAALALALAVSAWRVGERHRGLATLALIGGLVATAAGLALLLVGPDIQTSQQVDVPIGWSAYVFGGGAIALVAAWAFARRLELEPLRLKPSLAPLLPPAPMDVRDMLGGHDEQRPSASGPEPVMDAPAMPLPSPSASAPPPPSATPPRAHELATAPPPRPAKTPTAPPRPAKTPTAPPRPAKSPTAPPPGPARSPTAAPPRPAKSPTAPPRGAGRPLSPPATLAAAPTPPKRRARTTPGPGTDPLAQPLARESQRAVGRASTPAITPELSRASTPAIESLDARSTIAHAVPPMPDVLEGAARRSGQRLATEADDRLDTAMRETEAITAVEIDHEAKARAHAGAGEADVGDDTESRVATSGERALSTAQLGVARAATEDPFGRATTHARAPDGGPLTEEVPAQSPEIGEHTEVSQIGEDTAHTPIPTTGYSRELADTPAPLVVERATSQLSTAPSSLPPPRAPSQPASGPTPACPQCEAPMAWVEEHLRFYCKHCRMYF